MLKKKKRLKLFYFFHSNIFLWNNQVITCLILTPFVFFLPTYSFACLSYSVHFKLYSWSIMISKYLSEQGKINHFINTWGLQGLGVFMDMEEKPLTRLCILLNYYAFFYFYRGFIILRKLFLWIKMFNNHSENSAVFCRILM